jgi:hypothetical protein
LTIKKTSSTLKRLLYSHNSDAMPLIHERKRAAEYATRLMQQAPNLTLNVTKAITSPVAIWSFASLGILIQLGVFVIASLVTYHWQLGERGSSSVVGYGFPLFLSGMLAASLCLFPDVTDHFGKARSSFALVSSYVLVSSLSPPPLPPPPTNRALP